MATCRFRLVCYVGMFNAEKTKTNPLSLTIEELGLRSSTYQCLMKADVRNVFDLTTRTAQELRSGSEITDREIDEIRDVLQILGRRLRGE